MLKNRLTGLVIVFLMMVSAGCKALHADKLRYDFPHNLQISFSEKIMEDGGKYRLSFIVTSMVGNLKNVEVYFSSSPDLKILSNTRFLPSLPEGESRKARILAVKTGLPADEMGSWVKVGIRYLPDFSEIRRRVSDEKAYPDSTQRQRLLDILQRNELNKERYHQTARHFIR